MADSASSGSSSKSRRAAGASWWNREDIVLLILLGVLFFLPGLGKITLFDRDEPRFATAARTMVETGDYIVPHFNGDLRPDKPPLVYWLMDAGFYLTGQKGELGARLPSAIAGLGTLIIIYFMVGSRFGRVTGMVSALMLGTCVLFMVMSRLATADGTMVMCIAACMACAWQAWDAAPGAAVISGGGDGSNGGRLPRTDYLLDRPGTNSPLMLDYLPVSRPRKMPLALALAFWVALAAGTLAKGVPLVFVGVPLVMLSLATGTLSAELKRWRSHFHLTRGRVGLALGIAGVVAVFEVAAASAHLPPEGRWWAAVLGVLFIGMTLTPGLPGVLAHCVSGGNWGWLRQLRPLMGIPLLIALVGWWVLLAGRATDWVLIKDMVGVHFLQRSMGPLLNAMGVHLALSTEPAKVDALKAYGQPPGFFLVMVWGTFWPWSILLVPAGYHAVRRVMKKTAIAIDPRPYQFLLAWIIPMWIVLELARGKLFHYPLPLYVPLAILCADTLVQSWQRMTDVLAAKWFVAMRWVTLVIWVGLGAAVLIAAQRGLESEWYYRCVPFAGALMATGFASATTWGKPSWPFVLVLAWGGALVILNTLLLPDFPMIQVSRTVGWKMAELKREDPSVHLAARGYQEGTLVFYAGSNVEMFETTDELVDQAFRLPGNVYRVENNNVVHIHWPQQRYVVAVDDKTLAELKERKVAFYPYYSLPRQAGIDTGNLKAVGVTLITNLPLEGATSSAPASSSLPATGP